MIFKKALNQITFFHKQAKDCYSILGLTRNADHSEIKAKYFELVKIYHPDHNKDPTAEEKFKEILKAYETLKDPIKRQLYDSDPINFDQSGSGFSANEMKPESSYYKDKNRREFYQNRWYDFQKPKEQTLYDEVQQEYEIEILVSIMKMNQILREFQNEHHLQFFYTFYGMAIECTENGDMNNFQKYPKKLLTPHTRIMKSISIQKIDKHHYNMSHNFENEKLIQQFFSIIPGDSPSQFSSSIKFS